MAILRDFSIPQRASFNLNSRSYIYSGSLRGHYGQTIEAKNKLVYCWPQWLLIVPDRFLSGHAAMRGPLSDLFTAINRASSVLSVFSARVLFFLRVLRILRGYAFCFLCGLSVLCG